MFKLAHISDVHLSPIPPVRGWELVSKRFIGYLNWNLRRAGHHRRELLDIVLSDLVDHAPDHIAVTGDLINIATRQEIKNAADWLDRLSRQADRETQLTVIAGNHDAYVPGALKSVLTEWRPFVAPDLPSVPTAADFPLVRIQNEIAIISCNSAEATLPFRATGFFRKDQARRLNAILEEHRDRFRVVLIHHLPMVGETAPFKRLVGAEHFAQCISQQGAELILHGHTHLQSLYWLQAPNGWTPVVGVSATAHAPGNKKPPGGYNLFKIAGEAQNWTCTLERFALGQTNEGQLPAMEKVDEAVLSRGKP